jgi:tetratricopeptide (TPR) repeat protein
MNFKKLLSPIVAAIALSALPAMAQDAAWQNSYALEAAGKYTEAIAAIDSVPVNGPEAELKLIRRGWLFYLPGRFDEAIREYRLAMERNSRSVDARLGVTLPLLAAKRWREAEQSARSALEMVPGNYTALIRLAVAQEGQRDWQGMARTGATLVSLYNSDATAHVYMARANAWLGKRDDALASYNAVLARYPGHLEAKAYIDKK